MNAVAVLVGGSFGLLLGRRLGDGMKGNLMKVLGVITMAVAFDLSLEGELVKGAASLLLGYIIGEAVNLEGFLKRHAGGGGFLTALLLFCVGPMTVVGSVRDALGQPDVLFVKAALDGVASLLLSSVLGASVLLSAPALLLVQVSLGLSVLLLAGQNPDLSVFNATGGMVLLLIALNLLGVLRFPTANTLPAFAIVPIWSLLS